MSAACSHATSTKASISGKFASFCGLGFPATTVYDLRPDLAMSSRRARDGGEIPRHAERPRDDACHPRLARFSMRNLRRLTTRPTCADPVAPPRAPTSRGPPAPDADNDREAPLQRLVAREIPRPDPHERAPFAVHHAGGRTSADRRRARRLGNPPRRPRRSESRSRSRRRRSPRARARAERGRALAARVRPARARSRRIRRRNTMWTRGRP